jgi:N-formylglutamate deformylase
VRRRVRIVRVTDSPGVATSRLGNAALMSGRLWEFREALSPVIAVALHAGHDLSPDLAESANLSDAERLREEDPFTGGWTDVADTQVVVHRSRFEVDLNRPREGAVYRTAAEAWGLDLWHAPLPAAVIERSLDRYDDFYATLERVLRSAEREFGRFVVYDLHSYNHRREEPVVDPAAEPDVNLGTGSLDRGRWAGVADRFLDDLRRHDFMGRSLDVRENVRFRGGHLSRWVHERFPESGCLLAIEVKKFFMDECTGALYPAQSKAVRAALAATVPGVVEELDRR